MQRRKFIKNAAAATAAFSIVPSFVLGKNHVPPSDTLYMAGFGIGGRGGGVIWIIDRLVLLKNYTQMPNCIKILERFTINI